MPPDRPALPPSVLAALGLVAASGCGPCLDVKACLNTSPPEHSGLVEHTGVTACLFAPLGHSGVSPCLVPPLEHTGAPHSADSGGSGGHTGSAAAAAPVFDRLATEGVLPPDVLERLGRKRR